MKIGFFGMLTLIFIVLKLTEVVAWSWWWVLAPMWIPLGLTVIVLLTIFCYTVATTGGK